MSQHKAEVVPIVLEPHGNADSLSVAKIFSFTYVAKTEDWAGVNKAVYIAPDEMVPVDRPEFAFLAKDGKDHLGTGRLYARIKAKKLRGVVSFGLCVPVPNETPVGEDWYERLELQHYEPAMKGGPNSKVTGGEAGPAPKCYTVKYDVENARRYQAECFTPGEAVVVTEKIHGANSRFVFNDGQMFCGSRTEWKKEFATIQLPNKDELIANLNKRRKPDMTDEEIEARADIIIANAQRKMENPEPNMWWKVLRNNLGIEHFCKAYPDHTVFGEVYGQVQDLTYGTKQGEIKFAGFDILQPDGKFLDANKCIDIFNGFHIPYVPLLELNYPYNFDSLCEMAEGNSKVHGAESQIAEGIVVKPIQERYHQSIGRVILKIVSSRYLEK